MPFWKPSGPSHSLETDPALEYPRSLSHQDQDIPQSPSIGAYNPYISGRSSTPQEDRELVPGESTLSSAVPTHVQYDHNPANLEQQSTPQQQAPRKSIKNRLFGSGAKAKEQAGERLGRKRSSRQGESPSRSPEPSLYQQNAAQWQPEHEVVPLSANSDKFSPQSPDFALEQPQREHQYLSHSRYPTSQPESLDAPPRAHPSAFQAQFAQQTVATPTSTTSTSTPNRHSLESSQRPPSRPEASSRSSSRASYEPYPAQQTIAYRPSPEQSAHEARLQAGDSGGASAYRAYQHQPPLQQQQLYASPFDANRTSQPLVMSGDQGRSQPATRSLAQQNLSMLPSSTASSSSQFSNRAQSYMQEGELGQRQGPPSRAPSELSDADMHHIWDTSQRNASELHELRKKYNNVKKEYHLQRKQLDSQKGHLDALQNTLAHQRLSQSRTQLDDGEYTQRIERLGGLVAQLAHAIRKDWARVPSWLENCVNRDAIEVGKQEMTAIGKAILSRWLVDEVFNKYFHSDLPSGLSRDLKKIQRTLRETAPPPETEEAEDALTAKITNWRLATIDGLRPGLSSEEASHYRRALSEALAEQMHRDIASYLKEPAPADLKGGIPMIIELAIGILANIPLESREVHIQYFLPGSAIDEELMKVETGIPSLGVTRSQDEAQDGDQASTAESTSSGRDKSATDASRQTDGSGRKGIIGSIMGGKKQSRRSDSPSKQESPFPPLSMHPTTTKQMPETPRVRMCVSLGLQIRGKRVLLKAPVYTM